VIVRAGGGGLGYALAVGFASPSSSGYDNQTSHDAVFLFVAYNM
jgi:hypothetical protein